jgi:hypothetical protein
MSNATLATIKNVNALLEGTSIAPIVIPAEPVKADAWKARPASKKQVARTVEMAAEKRIHTMRNVKSGEMMPINEENVAGMTAGGASKLYNALKNLTVKENVTVKPATITVKEARKAQKEAKKAARKARNAVKLESLEMVTGSIEDNVNLHGFDARYA